MSEAISAIDPYTRKRVEVLDSDMAYIDTGSGDPIVFLHGNPTSSYLWRNVIREVEGSGRCLAPDLIGMGESGKASKGGDYTFAGHAKYLDAWFDAVIPSGKLVLVVHDWGSGLGFHWAKRRQDRVEGIVYMEAIVRPVTWDEWPEAARKIFRGMRSEAGEEMVLEKNVFVERILPASILRGLSDEEMEVYRRPYLEAGESRRPTLTWPRQIPLDGTPEDVTKVVEDYAKWLASEESPPKLFVNAEPGTILIGKQRDFCRTWPKQEEISVKGLHFIQEDSPVEIGRAIADFVNRLRHQGA